MRADPLWVYFGVTLRELFGVRRYSEKTALHGKEGPGPKWAHVTGAVTPPYVIASRSIGKTNSPKRGCPPLDGAATEYQGSASPRITRHVVGAPLGLRQAGVELRSSGSCLGFAFMVGV
jgi:hypothetical protein